MRRMIVSAALAALFVVFLGTGAVRADLAGPNWMPYSQGLAQAKSEGKHLLVEFFTKSCSQCQRMDKKTFSDPGVIEYINRHYVPVRVNANLARQMAMNYNIRGVPTVWFMEPDGTRIAPVPGFVPPEMFRPLLEYVRERKYESMSFSDFMKEK